MKSLSQLSDSQSQTLPATLMQGIIIPQDNQALSDEITRLAGRINAAQYRFLKLLAVLIDRDAWGGDSGFKSPAHWLHYYCGIAMGAAREKVRVAMCLDSLPLIDQAFQSGEISFSMVRAMTRAARVENEDYLLGIARTGTTAHMESLIRKYKRVERLNTLNEESEGQGMNQHQSRELSSYFDEDGMLVFKGKLAPEEGEIFMKVLEAAFDQLSAKDVSAETSFAPDIEENQDTCTQKRADALGLMAEHFLGTALNNAGVPLSGGDKYQVVVHVDVENKGGESALCTHSYLDNGLTLCPETVKRLACDASLVTVLEDSSGNVLNVGRKTRTIPPSIRRALTIRDQGCRFPGCCESRHVDAHHIQHWCDGGETSLDNLVLLCKHHHRLLHEGSYSIERKRIGCRNNVKDKDKGNGISQERNIVFRNAQGRIIPRSIFPQFDAAEGKLGGVLVIERQHDIAGMDIDSETAGSKWLGEDMDYDLGVEGMCNLKH